MAKKSSASVDLVRVLIRYAAALGLDLGGVWQVVGLDPERLETSEARIPIAQFNIRFVEIRFRHPQPTDTTEHERIFRCPLAFGQSRNELVMWRGDLDLPIFLANPELLETLERFAREMLYRLTPPESWSDRVRYQIGRALMRGDKPMLGTVASELAISPRHLQNKLKGEGTTYRVLLDELRRETALKYLRKPHVPIFDVAFFLGFSDQSAFNHAFKRWTGVSPQQYRKLALLSVPSGCYEGGGD